MGSSSLLQKDSNFMVKFNEVIVEKGGTTWSMICFLLKESLCDFLEDHAIH